MNKTRVITTALVRFNNHYLVAKRALTKQFAPGQWELISGFVDTQETTEQIILRELLEETKLTGTILKTAEPFSLEDEEGRWIVIPYLIEANSETFVLNKKDHSEIKWVKKTELKDYKDILPFLKGLKKLL